VPFYLKNLKVDYVMSVTCVAINIQIRRLQPDGHIFNDKLMHNLSRYAHKLITFASPAKTSNSRNLS